MSTSRKSDYGRPRRARRGGPRIGSGWRLLMMLGGGGLLLFLALWIVAGMPGLESEPKARRFPSFVYNSATTLAGYEAAVAYPDALSVIPCYCGCGPVQNHISLANCFFTEDGSLNDHASNCHLCVEEAVDVGQWAEEGQPLKQIRTQIEAKYQDHGPGTNTPPVA